MAGARISKQEVVRLVKKYKKSGEKNNTKSVWFSLSEMEEVIKLIRELNDNSGKAGDGVRLYFGRYTEKSSASKKNRNTIVFVPTYNLNGGAIHFDFILDSEVRAISDEIGDPDESLLSEVSVLGDPGEEGYNHGSLCPDQCEGTSVGDA